MEKRYVDWNEFGRLVERLSEVLKEVKVDLVVGIARGGLPVSLVIADRLRVPVDFINIKSYRAIGLRGKPVILSTLSEDIKDKVVLVVDDLIDEGDTMMTVVEHLKENHSPKKIYTATLFIKPWSKFKPDFYLEVVDKWIVFPWEKMEFGN